jgi:hypothetical protein
MENILLRKFTLEMKITAMQSRISNLEIIENSYYQALSCRTVLNKLNEQLYLNRIEYKIAEIANRIHLCMQQLTAFKTELAMLRYRYPDAQHLPLN